MSKVKAYTRRQLNRARRQRELEARTEGRADKQAARQQDRWLRKVEAAFKGCEVDE